MSAKSFLEEAFTQGRVIKVQRFDEEKCVGRGRALVLDPILHLSDMQYRAKSEGHAVMLEDCGFAENSRIKAGSIVKYWDRPGDGFVVSSGTNVDPSFVYSMPEMTIDEANKELTQALIEDDAQTRAKNLQNARKENLLHVPGRGYVNKSGQLIYDEDGREY